MAEHIGFREFVGSLQPMFKVVSRNNLKNDILNIYDNEREKALKMMNKKGNRITITTDMRTSSNKREGSWSLLLTLSTKLRPCKARF